MPFTRIAAVCAAVLGFTASVLGAPGLTRTVLPNGDIAAQDMLISVPSGWKLAQDAISGDTMILGFSQNDDYVTYYVSTKPSLDMKGVFVNGSKLSHDVSQELHGKTYWNQLEAHKTVSVTGKSTTFYVAAFETQYMGHTYYGYARSTNESTARANAKAFLDATRPSGAFSLTGPDYTGKKYYFGFGDDLDGEMGNEVKYDIQHTHDIFTKGAGGNYIGTVKIVEPWSHELITGVWKDIASQMTANDMYVQYSSGHGSEEALMSGVSYDEIRDNALSMPAKEIVIFTMACYSGNLVDSFNKKKSVWQNWQSQGRSLLVMSSSRDDESSVTGPGTDDDEPNGPDGSAGSAFGHALWKSLIGYSDGYLDGVKDGFISLGEIREFARARTLELGGHTPMTTGVYNMSLIMNQVPSKAFLDSIGESSEHLTDAELKTRIQALDAAFRVQ